MTTVHGAVRLDRTTGSPDPGSSLLERCRGAFRDWRKQERLPADFDLRALDERELMDIGMTRGEADDVASNRLIDPRGIRSSRGWIFRMAGVRAAAS